MSDHSRFAPSSAGIWSRCSGSIQLSEMYPRDRSGPAAAEGTVTHTIAADMVRAGASGGSIGTIWSARLDTVIDGITVTREMVDAARLYAETILERMRSTHVFGGEALGIEETVPITPVHPTCTGTPDAYIWDRSAGALYIYDLKTGFGIVEPEENRQLLCYAIGVCARLQINPSTITLGIVQPRAPHRRGPVRLWTLTEPLGQWVTVLADAARRADEDPCTVSGAHCRYCDALLHCENARGSMLSAMDRIGDMGSMVTDPDSLWYELFMLRRAAEIVDHRIKALETEIAGRIRAGERVPHFTLTSRPGNKAWTVPAETVLALASSFGIDAEKRDVLTPTQLCKAGVPREIIDTMSTRPPGKVRVEFDDLSTARRVFGQKSTEEK